jgi:hypothetical protein
MLGEAEDERPQDLPRHPERDVERVGKGSEHSREDEGGSSAPHDPFNLRPTRPSHPR